uniref:hypothetical protein n=1 Tax=uncultured Bacteroides sp. TaxID=162156 RepID=UPI00262583C4
MKITNFSSLMTKEAEGVIDATEWIRDIRDGKFKPTVDQVRSMIKGITQKEIERAIRWGYEHGEEGGKSPTNWGQGGQISNMFPFHTVKTEENPDSEEIAENEKEEEEVIEEQCPQFA